MIEDHRHVKMYSSKFGIDPLITLVGITRVALAPAAARASTWLQIHHLHSSTCDSLSHVSSKPQTAISFRAASVPHFCDITQDAAKATITYVVLRLALD